MIYKIKSIHIFKLTQNSTTSLFSKCGPMKKIIGLEKLTTKNKMSGQFKI